MQLFDTHTHFDFAIFHSEQVILSKAALQAGVTHILIAGVTAKQFGQLSHTKDIILSATASMPSISLAAGLHPAFIHTHHIQDLQRLEHFLEQHDCVAIGEIGLDTYEKNLKTPENVAKQEHFFNEQLLIAKAKRMPVILHIRKSHAAALKTIKTLNFSNGGIAHSFSGGLQEGKAFANLGFKIGISGQVCNPNAKKLHRTIQALGAKHLVIETDSPDMLPYQLHASYTNSQNKEQQPNNTMTAKRNEPKNLIYVFNALADILQADKEKLAHQLWQNSLEALQI